MKVIGIDGMTRQQLKDDIDRGGRFVIYQYCISVVILTFKRPSDIYFVPAGESALKKGLGFSALSMVLGWWGFPWGPIYTIGSFVRNFGGGRDVTYEVLNSLG